MRQITKEKGKRDALYLLYVPVKAATNISPSKSITIFRISGAHIEILYSVKSERDLNDNVAVHEYREPYQSTQNIFKNLCMSGSALFELNDTEARLFLVEYI